jgi:hypothetical protein
MNRQRIYADTSAIGGCLDEEFRGPSVRLFDAFRTGTAVLVLSDLTRLELQHAPEDVRAIIEALPAHHVEHVPFTEEASRLAERYIVEKVIGAAMRLDAQHIATATVHRVDVLVSWNFKHIVNLPRIRGYNSVNLRAGYPILEIRSPEEVVPDAEEADE